MNETEIIHCNLMRVQMMEFDEFDFQRMIYVFWESVLNCVEVFNRVSLHKFVNVEYSTQHE